MQQYAVPLRRADGAGDVLELLVLALAAGELIGVDLASGAFVRARDPGGPALRPFDVVSVELAATDAVWSPHAPESVEVEERPVEPTGRLTRRRADRWLRPLVTRGGGHLLGFPGPATPFWTLRGDHPSLALVEPRRPPVVRPAGHGYRCQFDHGGRAHDLPLVDARLLALLERHGAWRCSGEALTHTLGYRPARVLVALSAPWRGHCYKVAAGLLP